MQFTYLLPTTVALLAALPLGAAENAASPGIKLSIVAPAESRTTRLVIPSGTQVKPEKLSTKTDKQQPSGSQIKVLFPSTEMRGWVEPAREPEIGGKSRRAAQFVDTMRTPEIVVAKQNRAEPRDLSRSQLRIAGVPQRSSADRLAPAVVPIASPVEPEATVVVPRQTLRLAPAPPSQPLPVADIPKVVIAEQQPRPQLAVRATERSSPELEPVPRPADRSVAVARNVVEPTATAPETSKLTIIEPAVPTERVTPHPMSAERTIEVTRRQVEPMPIMPEPEMAPPVEPMLEPEPMTVVSEPPRISAPRPAMASRSVKPRSVTPKSVAKPVVPRTNPPPIVYSTPPMPKPAVYRGYTVPGRSPIPFGGRGISVQRPFHPDQYDSQLARTPEAQLPANQRANVEATADQRHARSAMRR